MGFIRAFIKLFLVFSIILPFIVISFILSPFLLPFCFTRRHIATKLSVFSCRLILKILNFHFEHIGPPPKEGSIIVGNHMSYLDILIYLSIFKCLFVTSVDMRRRPFLGQLVWFGGCLYVERRNPRNLHKELKTIKKYFDKGFLVCFFPEGTSSDGKTVLPFKKSLFQLALETSAPIQPIVLNYKTINGENFGDANRDSVCWYGSHTFLAHFINLIQLKKVTAQLQVLSPINSTNFENRKNLAEQSHHIILEKYHKNLDT